MGHSKHGVNIKKSGSFKLWNKYHPTDPSIYQKGKKNAALPIGTQLSNSEQSSNSNSDGGTATNEG